MFQARFFIIIQPFIDRFPRRIRDDHIRKRFPSYPVRPRFDKPRCNIPHHWLPGSYNSRVCTYHFYLPFIKAPFRFSQS
jgi:hypothetical protein